ncbi:MAG: U32 family peptidase [Deltaproteobacteria bacterium]|nr:U32 family peptidase [Candidatus Tharpella sp.]
MIFNERTKPELLAPAGNREKLEIAIAYGADAVYFGSREFSLRRRAGNFSLAQIADAVDYCREHGVKAYLAINLLPYNADMEALGDYLRALSSQPPDALIVGDPGVVVLCREILPEIPIHLSTQSNTLNYLSTSFWQKNGVSRVNLARELSLPDIAEVINRVPGMECEIFVHGAMCMAYSGRCLLSAVLTGRHANRGDCAQPCRWRYALQEETRPGEFMTLEEDERGSYVFNAKDLCLIARLAELDNVGVHSFKIEGRMKSAYYVAVVTRVYRQAIDQLYTSPKTPFSQKQLEKWKNELTKVSHRHYTEGFIDKPNRGVGEPSRKLQYITSSAYIRSYRFCALVLEVLDNNFDYDSCLVRLNVKDRLTLGVEIEVVTSDMKDFVTTIVSLQNERGEKIDIAHPGTIAIALCLGGLHVGNILRQPIIGTGVAV